MKKKDVEWRRRASLRKTQTVFVSLVIVLVVIMCLYFYLLLSGLWDGYASLPLL